MTDPMAGIVWSPIGHVEPETLVVLDAQRRMYAGLSRDGTYWHLIQPARPDDPRVTAIPRLREVGQLVCSCSGGTFRGTCYQVKWAEKLEGHVATGVVQAPAAAAPTWLRGDDSPAGAGYAVEAERG